MSDNEVPEADALEQAQPLEDAAAPIRETSGFGLDAEVPEADALEQAQPVNEPAPLHPAGPPTIASDTPEADALEQALQPADDDDEEVH